jgi:hypothetical protein
MLVLHGSLLSLFFEDIALNLIDTNERQSSSSLLSYHVCLQKGEVLYADGEFETGSYQ